MCTAGVARNFPGSTTHRIRRGHSEGPIRERSSRIRLELTNVSTGMTKSKCRAALEITGSISVTPVPITWSSVAGFQDGQLTH